MGMMGGMSYAVLLLIPLIRTEDPPRPAAQPEIAIIAPLPELRLAAIPEHEDETAFRRSIAAKAEEWLKTAEVTEDRMAKIEFQLAAANVILARELEPLCSHAVLETITKVPTAGIAKEQASEALDRANAALSSAETLLQTALAESPEDNEKVKDAERRREVLQSFADALRAVIVPMEGAEGPRQARKAASRLSILLEDTNPRITTAAILWYALLRSREGDRDAAIAVLDSALSDPPRQSMIPGFFARIMRCQLMAPQGGHAAAFALLVQLEPRCDLWFTDRTQREDALRTLASAQWKMLRDWHDRLETAQESERRWCADRMAELAAERFKEGTTLLRLGLTVPIIAEAPNAPRTQSPSRDEP